MIHDADPAAFLEEVFFLLRIECREIPDLQHRFLQSVVLILAFSSVRDRRNQHFRIVFLRILEDLLRCTGLYDLTILHNVDTVAEIPDDAHIVRDEQHRHMHLLI